MEDSVPYPYAIIHLKSHKNNNIKKILLKKALFFLLIT